MYEAFYGLSAGPFQLNPDAEFYFESAGHRRAYAYLQYGVAQGEGFVVVTGEIGAGKTTLVRALLTELDAQKVIAVQLVSTQLDADDLLRSVAIAFGLPGKASRRVELVSQIQKFLVDLVPSGRRALLVVDEAQNLTPDAMEELRALSSFQLDGRHLLQSFLVGQPELRKLMRAPSMRQLRERVIVSYHLGPMDEAETRAYIEHRLSHVGWKNDPEFDGAAFALIFKMTGGIPRRINSLCNRLLLGAYLSERHHLHSTDVAKAAGEMREEMGADALPPETPETPPEAPPETPAAEAAPGPAVEARGADFMRSQMLSSLTARLDRLERNVAAILEIVQRIPGVEATKPAVKRTGTARVPTPGSGPTKIPTPATGRR